MTRTVRFVQKNTQRAGRFPARLTFILHIALIATAMFLFSSPTHAKITRYTNRDAWFDAVGGESAVTTVGFSEFGLTTITNQYQDLGVLFTDGNDTTHGEDFIAFPRDGWGLDGNFDIQFEFDIPRASVSVDHPGAIEYDFYLDNQHLGTASFFSTGADNFSGVTTSFLFDKVILNDPGVSEATIDDLHFVTIPAPAAFLPFTFLLVRQSSRARRPCH